MLITLANLNVSKMSQHEPMNAFHCRVTILIVKPYRMCPWVMRLMLLILKSPRQPNWLHGFHRNNSRVVLIVTNLQNGRCLKGLSYRVECQMNSYIASWVKQHELQCVTKIWFGKLFCEFPGRSSLMHHVILAGIIRKEMSFRCIWHQRNWWCGYYTSVSSEWMLNIFQTAVICKRQIKNDNFVKCTHKYVKVVIVCYLYRITMRKTSH